MTCQQRLREERKPYPRTCEECGLGPCKYGIGQRPAYQQRVLEEKADLDARLARLNAFFSTESFAKLDGFERDRMKRQAGYMAAYSSTLRERIEAWR